MQQRASQPTAVAYVTSMYPKASHTFILREIAALEAAGAPVLRCSIREPAAAELIGSEEQAEHARTFFVVAAARRNPLRAALAHLRALVRGPGRYLRALGLALRLNQPGLRGLAYRLFYFAEAGVLADHLRAAGAGRIHNHLANASCTVSMLAGALTGLPYSFTIHGPDDFFNPAEIDLPLKIARAGAVVCISRFCRSQCMLFSAPEDWEKLHVVHCGVETGRYAPRAAPAGSKRIVFIGRLAAVKGAPLLLEAAARLAPAHPELQLVVVGDGPDRAAVETEIARRGLEGVVRLTGYLSQSEVAAQLAEADILALPSFAEGVPIVLMEAMASGIPVVASRVGGVAELVEDGVSGFLIHASDVDGLTGRLGALLADPALRARMGRAGRAKVEAEFDIAVESRRLVALLGPEAD